MTDQELLQDYVRTGAQAAFCQIVSRHIGFVYSSAKRQVHDAHLAEDVTQVVFMVLARKASSIPSNAVLSGWLFKTTRYAAADALKAARRRQYHEREAAQMNHAPQTPDKTWEALSPHLEDGLAILSERERSAVLLRFFEGKSLRETGAALGIPEDAAAKRISRAIERLRAFFSAKGITLSAAGIAGAVSARAVEAAPAGLAASVSDAVLAAAGSAVSGHVVAATDNVIRMLAWSKVKAVAIAVAALALAAVVAVAIQQGAGRAGGERAAAGPSTRPAPFVAVSADQLRSAWGPEWANIPIAPGWPVALPGNVTGTPVVADLDGDGKLEVIVPAMARSRADASAPVVHPNPTIAATVFAFRQDGTALRGWPIVLLDEAGRMRDRTRRPAYAENWAASPSVADIDGDGRDEIVMIAPPTDTFTFVLNREGFHPRFPLGLRGGEVWSGMPVVDLNGDGILDLVCRDIVIGTDGKPVPGWGLKQPMQGFAPCVGDANGDGAVEIYYSAFFSMGSAVHGLDRTGRELPGWPQKITGQCLFPPVMGDVNGDGKMEILAADSGAHILMWTWDGRPLPSTWAIAECASVFKDGIGAAGASLTLADLDGDGAAEIITFDPQTKAIKAWRGDGRGLFAADGTLVRLPDLQCWGGVTGGDLDNDGVMDLFIGTYWVQLDKDGKTRVINMLPRTQPTTTQCTITDLDRDGKAEIVFALVDGRVFVYRTEKGYRDNWMQWPTPNGDFRHTGVWRPALPR